MRSGVKPMRVYVGSILEKGAYVCATNAVLFGSGGASLELDPTLRNPPNAKGTGLTGAISIGDLAIEAMRLYGNPWKELAFSGR